METRLGGSEGEAADPDGMDTEEGEGEGGESEASAGPAELVGKDAELVGGDEERGVGGGVLARSPRWSGGPEPDWRGYVYLAMMVVIGSTTAPVAKIAVRQLPVDVVPLLRFGCAAACLMPFLSDRGAIRRIVRGDPLRLLMVAALCVPVNQRFFLSAARLGPNSHIGLFYATCPLVVWVLAWVLGLEILDFRRLRGILASIAGIFVISLGNLLGFEPGIASEVRGVLLGDLLLVGAVVSWGAYLTLSRPLILRYGALPVLTATFLGGCLLELPLVLARLPAWASTLGRAGFGAWASLAILAVVITPLNLALQNLSLRRLDASQVAVFSNAAPVLTVIWGIVFFQEPVSLALLLGGLLTVGGIVLSIPRRRPLPSGSSAGGRRRWWRSVGRGGGRLEGVGLKPSAMVPPLAQREH